MKEDGHWVTINGTHVFVKDGQSPMDAFIRQKGGKVKPKDINEEKNTQAIPIDIDPSEDKKYFDSDESTKYFFKDGKFDESKNNEWNELKRKVFDEDKRISEAIDKNVEENLNRKQVFTTNEGIKQWGNKLGISIDDEFIDTIDKRALNDIKPVLEKTFQDYPELKKDFKLKVMEGKSLHDGYAEANDGLTLNIKEFEDYSKALKDTTKDRINGRLVKGNGTIETLYTHEIGHWYKNKMIEKKFFDYEHKNFGEKAWSTKEYDDVKFAFRNKMRKDIEELKNLKGVSKYAKTNDEELFAEGFAEYRLGNSEFGKAFGNKLKEWEKEVEHITNNKWGEMSTSQLMNKYIAQGYSKEKAIEKALEEKRK